MLKKKKIGCLSLLLLSPLTMAMQPLDDQTLAKAIGQDGLNIGINVSKIDFKQIAIIDTDGFGAGSSKAGLVVAANPNGATPGVDFVQTFNSDGTIQNSFSELLQAVIDTDAGTVVVGPNTGGAFANIAVMLGSGVNGIRIRPLSVYLVPDDPVIDAISIRNGSVYMQKSIFSSGTTLKSNNIKELLRTDNIDIKFVAANKPTMNIQLGAAPQGHMIKFGGAIDSICGPTTANPDGCTLNLVSGTTAAKFDLQMSGEDANGFSLNGFYAGIEAGAGSIPGAVVFGNTGTSDKLNLSLNNIKMGDEIPVGNLNSNIFNGLQNGSLGNIGAVGVSATNLKMRVSGM